MQTDPQNVPPQTPSETPSETATTPATTPAADNASDTGSENARLLEALQRERADFANFRRRAREEAADARWRGKAEVLLELLPVFESLEKAYAMLPPQQASEAWGVGIKNIVTLSAARLQALRLERIATTETAFDGHRHEAVSQVPGAHGTIVAELEPGYLLEERILKAARVITGDGSVPPADGPLDGTPEETRNHVEN